MGRMPLLLKVLAGVVGLVVLAYLVVNGAAVVRARQQRDDIADQVTRALEGALPASTDRQQDVIAATGREPDVRWVEQACEFSTDDSGWIVQRYRETCRVRSVTAWAVESPEEAQGLLAVEGHESRAYDGCRPLGAVDGAAVTYVDDATADGDPWCTGGLGTSSAARGLVGDRAAIGPGRWLLVVDDQPLLDEPIGCVRWSVLFCDNPFGDEHAFGEAPTDE
jgi:hypothetical protein